MTGSSVESVMTSNDDDLMQVDGNDGPPLLITQFGEEEGKATAAPAVQSDEELAKKLAAEWGSMPAAAADQNAKSDEDYARELQAKWDAEDSGDMMAGVDILSQAATTDDISTFASVRDRPPTPIPEGKMEEDSDDGNTNAINAVMDAKVEAIDNQSQSRKAQKVDPERHVSFQPQQQLDFEKHGLSFPLYHYNVSQLQQFSILHIPN